jgi:predicted MFS family arabinose efflux permease
MRFPGRPIASHPGRRTADLSQLRCATRKMIIVRNGSFGLLWSGQLLSSMGTWLLVVAVPVYVFRLTGSARDTGLAIVAETLPSLVTGPFAGVFVDRWSRRHTMIISDLLRAGSVSALVFFNRPGQLWVLLAAVFAENAFGTFFDPAHRALVPAVAGRGTDLEIANAWYAVSRGIVRLAGAPLGGALYTVAGFKPLVAIDAATYAVSAVLIALMPALRTAAPAPIPAGAKAAPARTPPAFLRGLATDLGLGVAGLIEDRVLSVLLVISTLFLLGNGAVTALLVPYVVTDLGAKAASVGVLLSALGAGYILSAYPGRKMCASRRLRANVAVSMAAVVVTFAGFFNWHEFAAAAVFIALAGLPGGAFLMLEQTLIQRRAPSHLIGKISSAYSTAETLATLAGALLASLLVNRLGLTTSLNTSITVIAAGGVLTVLLPTAITRPHDKNPPASAPALCTRAQPGRTGVVAPEAIPGQPCQTGHQPADGPGEDPAQTDAVPARPPRGLPRQHRARPHTPL